ncbi:MAG: SDR family oxidoreductase [Sphingobacteriales bacterium]|nr:MAG: SDR family oxidoreductase [Sphingobacteriales bacterium]
MRFDFSTKTILITGATRGIGMKIAEDLSLLGADLLLTGTNPEQVKELNDLAVQQNFKRKYFCVDLLDRASVEMFISSLKSYPLIDGLVNNAGINRLNPVTDALESDWDDMVQVNLTAPFRLVKEISAGMIRNGYGRIVNIASIFSTISKEKRAVYSATKFGLHGLTVGSSNDLARYNILVNTLSPGFVMTDLTRKNLSEIERAQLADQVPIKRLAEVQDISNVAVFLLSDLNRYLTGQNIVVDGGFTNV